MNKQVIQKQLFKLGIIVERITFDWDGYNLVLRLDPKKASGWEELETTNIEGFDVILVPKIDEYVAYAVLIPNTQREFNAYIKKYTKVFQESCISAMEDLEKTIYNYGNGSSISKFKNFKNKLKGEKHGTDQIN